MNSRRLSSVGIAAAVLAGFFVSLVPGSAALAAACTPVQSNAGTDVVLRFTNTTACDWTVPAGVTSVQVLLIGGGGGGGFDIGGGGGADQELSLIHI